MRKNSISSRPFWYEPNLYKISQENMYMYNVLVNLLLVKFILIFVCVYFLYCDTLKKLYHNCRHYHFKNTNVTAGIGLTDRTLYIFTFSLLVITLNLWSQYCQQILIFSSYNKLILNQTTFRNICYTIQQYRLLKPIENFFLHLKVRQITFTARKHTA